MNFRGQLGDQLMVFSYLFIMVMVSLAIVGGAYLFYGSEIDFRPTEVQLLTRATMRCFLAEDFNWGLAKTDSSYIFTTCRLNKQAMESHSTLLRICVDSANCITEQQPLFSLGNDFVICGLKGAQANEKMPKCRISSFSLQGKRVQILAISNQWAKSEVG